MSKNQTRSIYTVSLEFKTGTVEHQLAPGLFRQLIADRLIVPTSFNRARVHQDYFAYIDHSSNQLRFISRADVQMLGGCSVALRYYLLWLYDVKYDKQGNPEYSELYKQHDQVYAGA